MTVSEAEMRALVGHELPGGTYRIAHWENFLLTEATGSAPLPDGIAHPIHLFHVPIAGAGVTLADLFALGRAESDASISIDWYDWELRRPLREDELYRMSGSIIEHERTTSGGRLRDSLTFRIDVRRDGERDDEVARVTFRWHFNRSAA
jgi:hypothetical protein